MSEEKTMATEEVLSQLKELIKDRKSKGDEVCRKALEEAVGAVSRQETLFDMLKYTVTEYCPHCGTEVSVVWNVKEDRHSIYCPNCSERIMLCSECPVRDCEAECDWNSYTDSHEEPVCFWDNAFSSTEEAEEKKNDGTISGVKQITKEQYDRAIDNRGYLTRMDMEDVFTIAELYVYDARFPKVTENDGKYFVHYKVNSDCR